MKYANGACSPWLPQERNDGDAMERMHMPSNKPRPTAIQRPGMAYVPMQMWRQPYELETGFLRGTIFNALDKPFLGDEGAC